MKKLFLASIFLGAACVVAAGVFFFKGSQPSAQHTLAAPFQALSGSVDDSGLTVTSLAKDEAQTHFSLTPTEFLRGDASSVTIAQTGQVSVMDRYVTLDRGVVAEEFSTSREGIRQDFLVPLRPTGEGELRLRMGLEGASAQMGTDGVRLTMDGSGRELVYNKLFVTDAKERMLPARFVVGNARTIEILIEDANAIYPIRIDPTISDADWELLGTGADNGVYTVAVDSQNNLYAAGGFIASFNGISANRIAKWNGSTWSALGKGILGQVNAIAIDSADNVYVGGNIASAGDEAVNYIAKWNGSVWSALGAGTNNQVTSLAVDSANNLYVGGTFTSAGGGTVNRIAKWNGSTWSALSTGADGTVDGLAVDSTDNLFATGAFTTVGGVSASRVARWNGIAWSALGTGLSSYGSAMAIDSGDNVYVGGGFLTAGGVSAPYIARWNGSTWSALGSSVDSSVSAIAIDSFNNVYVGGAFTNAGGSAANRIAIWDGSAWAALGSGVNNVVRGLVVDGRDDLYVGGLFTSAGGVSVGYIAKVHLFRRLTYTAGANGSISGTTPQTVDYGANGSAVTAVPDSGYSFVSWSDASSTNPRIDYNVTSSKSLTATFAASAVAGVTIVQTGGPLAVTEGGTTDAFTVVLDSEPASVVQIGFTTSTLGLTLSTSTLTFTPLNWNSVQTVNVSATNDLVYEGTATTSVQPTVTSAAAGYTSLALSPFTATITDNDTAGVTLSETTASVTEAGATDTYTLVLNTEPTSTVEILLSLSNGQITLSTSTIAFTPSNWNVPATVTTTAVDDSSVEGSHTSTITHTASSTNLGYVPALSIGSVVVTITDNDVAPSSGGGGGGGGAVGGSPIVASGYAATTTRVVPIVIPVPIEVTFLDEIPVPAPVLVPVPAPIAPVRIGDRDVWPLEDGDFLTNGLRVKRDLNIEIRTTRHVIEDLREFQMTATPAQIDRLQLFMAYGDSWATMRLGEGERRAVIRDVLQTLQIVTPTAEDLDRVTRGIKPQFRNLNAEKGQLIVVRQVFKKLYGRDPNFKDPKEDKAWNVLMYRVRFPRDLTIENKGRLDFIKRFGRVPTSPLDWATVRVLGYVM